MSSATEPAAPQPPQPQLPALSNMPWLSTLRIGFIGAGRLGKALAWCLTEHGLCVSAVASHSPASARALAASVPGCQVLDAQQTVDVCDLVFITTPDSAIASTANALRWRAGMAVVHCSGATEVSALDSAARAGAQTGGFHPMQTFGNPAAAARSLPGCTITLEADQPLDATLVALAERLGCAVNRLPPGMRARYHAAAGFTSQFLNVLFREACDIWKSWGATEAEAVRALLPMARGTLASIESAGVAAGMPGPVSRGDVDTVHKHVEALGNLDAEVLDFYRALCERTVRLAIEHGAFDAATATRFRAALRG